MARKWIAGAIKRPGALTKKAHAAGESVGEFCRHEHRSTRTRRQCNLARTLRRVSRK